ncbi:MAG: methyltransferase domain-containing protein, partial [Pyramidobacter sp.]|nr:methyltransferase domain-containing protein [Pyramidobacter sp.]
MDNVYGKNYDVAVYDDAQRWTAYFKPIAARIAAELAPKSVLDAGCGHGFLVAALRDLGIEAWGLDLSEAALSKARSDVREYCAAGTIAGPLPEELPARFDLAVCIETMQYLHEDDVRAAVATLCAAADAVLFVSSPEDMNQPAHLNSRQPEYWARLFAERGFLPNLRYTPDFIAPHARLFEKHAIDARAIEEYEHFRRVLDRENRALKDDAQRLNAACDQYRAMIASLDNEVKELRGSTCWKITYPVRKTLDLLKIACRNGGRAAVYYRRHGAANTFSRIARELRRSSPAPVPVPN